MEKVVVRFAPSPTGPLHIGGVRTCLYNYLFAKKNNGKLILRIEDTDSQRFVPNAEKYIIDTFKWFGISFDEGVGIGGDSVSYRQSERREIYRQYVKYLIDNGKAYYAFDSKEELDAKRKEISNFQYNAYTRMSMKNSLSMKDYNLDDYKGQYVVRFKIDPNKDIIVNDILRGDVLFKSSFMDDKIIYKSSDDLPTYHLANIVDDHLMNVTHVIRGEEWLPSAPLHFLIYQAFGWDLPKFAHLPLILAPDSDKKLSKRDGDKYGFPVFPLEWEVPNSNTFFLGYREEGYLPNAVLNFLALLGWNPGNDQDIMSMDEMIEKFDLEKCSKCGAHFDFNKLKWFNHQYLQNPNQHVFNKMKTELYNNNCMASDDYIWKVIEAMKDRFYTLKDLWPQCNFFFKRPETFDTSSKWWNIEYLKELTDFLSAQDAWDGKMLEPIVIEWINSKGYKIGKVMNALRMALVGEARGPHIFIITDILGKEETLARANLCITNNK